MLVENSPDSHNPVEIGDLGPQNRYWKWGGKAPCRPFEAVRSDSNAKKGLFYEAQRVG